MGALLLCLSVACAHGKGGGLFSGGDRDSDSIADARDKCPQQPEDLDGFQDEDGCPDLDNDNDGILDAKDLCPNVPEDRDGFEDRDGCPEADNDKDRIIDSKDRCPNVPENYNGFEDEDGCPDPSPYDMSKHGGFTDNLFVARPVFFAPGSAQLSKGEALYLDRYASWLASEGAVEVVAVVGHAAADERDPAGLGDARARAVAMRLGKRVARSRLQAHSAGTQPAREWAPVKRPRWKDRSVHFRYFRLAGKTLYRWVNGQEQPAEGL